MKTYNALNQKMKENQNNLNKLKLKINAKVN